MSSKARKLCVSHQNWDAVAACLYLYAQDAYMRTSPYMYRFMYPHAIQKREIRCHINT
jgi:hypothetical protein